MEIPLQDGAKSLPNIWKAAGFAVDLQGCRLGDADAAPYRSKLQDIGITHGTFLPERTLIGSLSPAPPGWWDTPAHQTVVDAFTSEVDPQKRVALWASVQKAMYDEVPYMKIGDFNAVSAKSTKLGESLDPAPWPYFWNASVEVANALHRGIPVHSRRYRDHRPGTHRGQTLDTLHFSASLLGMIVVMFLVVTIVTSSSCASRPVIQPPSCSAPMRPRRISQDLKGPNLGLGYGRSACNISIISARLLKGDLGQSIFLNMPVTSALLDTAKPTFFLTIFSRTLAGIIALPIGINAAYRRGSFIDQAATKRLRCLPPAFRASGSVSSSCRFCRAFRSGSHLRIWRAWLTDIPSIRRYHLTLAAFALGIVSSKLILRFITASMLDVLGDDYIRTARPRA